MLSGMYTPVMPAVGRRRQEVHEFEADQGCFQEKEDKKLYSVTCYLVFPFFIYFYLFFIFLVLGIELRLHACYAETLPAYYVPSLSMGF
jgi:hypothetical protein